VFDAQVPVGEHRNPGPERGFREAAIVDDHVRWKNFVRDEPYTLVGEPGRELIQALSGPRRQRCVVQPPDGSTGRGPRDGRGG
jgi:hypothetical protein